MSNINLLRSKQVPLEFSSDPKKFKKYHKIKFINTVTDVTVHQQGIMFLLNKHANLTPKQLLTFLKLLKPELKKVRGARVHLDIKLDTVLTKKPKDIRMGRGKGAPSEKVSVLKAGSNLFTIYGVSHEKAEVILDLCLPKLSKSFKINKGK
jgi:ribosomal protein L16/L10AE